MKIKFRINLPPQFYVLGNSTPLRPYRRIRPAGMTSLVALIGMKKKVSDRCLFPLLLATACLSFFAGIASSLGQNIKEISPAVIDEEYFLVRFLEQSYSSWPQTTDPAVFMQETSLLRETLLRFRMRAEKAGFDPRISAGYAHHLDLIKFYAESLRRLHKVESSKWDGIEEDVVGSIEKGGNAAHRLRKAQGDFFPKSSLEQSIKEVTGTKSLVDKIGGLPPVIGGGIVTVVDFFRSVSDRTEKTDVQLWAIGIEMTQEVTRTIESTRRDFIDLSNSKGWSWKEMGWSVPSSEKVLSSQGNHLPEIERLLALERTARPQDPFAAFNHNLVLLERYSEDPKGLEKIGANFFLLLNLIPNDPVYQNVRLEFMKHAGAALLFATVVEQTQSETAPTSTILSQNTEKAWKDILEIDPTDSTGAIRTLYSAACLFNKNSTQAHECLISIFPLMKESPEYLYILACSYAQKGDMDMSLKALETSLCLGVNTTEDLADISHDKNLSPLRLEKGSEMLDLLAPRWEWNVLNGVMYSDIYFTNKSAFPLTSVKLQSSGGFSPPLALTADCILPGQTIKWEWQSKPTGREKPSLTLFCDQTIRSMPKEQLPIHTYNFCQQMKKLLSSGVIAIIAIGLIQSVKLYERHHSPEWPSIRGIIENWLGASRQKIDQSHPQSMVFLPTPSPTPAFRQKWP